MLDSIGEREILLPQTEKPTQQCTASWNFDFGQFADQIEENRFDLGATLGTLFATEAIGTMPKHPPSCEPWAFRSRS